MCLIICKKKKDKNYHWCRWGSDQGNQRKLFLLVQEPRPCFDYCSVKCLILQQLFSKIVMNVVSKRKFIIHWKSKAICSCKNKPQFWVNKTQMFAYWSHLGSFSTCSRSGCSCLCDVCYTCISAVLVLLIINLSCAFVCWFYFIKVTQRRVSKHSAAALAWGIQGQYWV